MRSFTVNVVPGSEGGRIPVGLAGQIMIDIQQLLSDIGEYLIRRELGVQNLLHPEILSRFVLYIDGNGGMSIGSSTEQKCIGTITDDTIDLMERTLDAMGSGAGGYWMEDNYLDPFYRNHIIYDIVALSEHVNAYPDCMFQYGSLENMKTFGAVDIPRMAAFLKDRGMTAQGAALGIVTDTVSKSKGHIIGFTCGKDRVRLQFRDKASENAARSIAGNAVYIAGKLMYSQEGDLMEIRDAHDLTPATEIRFRRLIAPDGDVSIKVPLSARVSYDGSSWTLSNEDLGLSVTKDNWDDTVQAFHDYFVFLWSEYMIGEKELKGEDAEIREYLRTLA